MDLVTPEFGLIFWQTVTLIVVIFILGKFAWNPILAMLQDREDNINASLNEAKKAKALILELELEKDNLVKAAALERDKILTEAFSAKNAILEEAKKEASLLMTQALEQTKSLIETERKSVVLELRKEVSDLSIQIAEKLLINQLSNVTEQTSFVENLIKVSSLK